MDRTDRQLTDEELMAALRADPAWRQDIQRSKEEMEAVERRGEKRPTVGKDELADFLRERL